jgi:hypothetical protein
LDVHPPHGPIRSVKDFLIHLLAITIGLLIALSLEAMVEWIHYRHLVHTAKANLATEIRENQQDLTKTLEALRTSEAQLQHFIKLVHQLEADRASPLSQLNFTWTLATLHDTSWNTARETGAIAHMNYEEAKRYTAVYALQLQYTSLQERAFASANAVTGLTTLLDKDMKRISQSELENSERTLGLALANARADEDVARALIAEYSRFSGQK